MPGSNLVRGGIFVAGLAAGLGTATLVNKRSASSVLPPPPPAQPHVVRDDRSTGLVASGSNAPLVSSPSSAPYGAPIARPVQPGSIVANEVFKYGFPGPIPDILKREAYVAAYDRRLRHPSWTAEHLTPTSLNRQPAKDVDPALAGTSRAVQVQDNPVKGDRSKSTFMEDGEVPVQFRALLKDYMGSGYDRGHMVPAADAKISQRAMDETFYLTNIAPQVGDGFNRHYWAYLEDWCRRLVRPRDEGMKGMGGFEDVYVFTVPLYLPAQGVDGKWRVSYEVIGKTPAVSVPTHFAKVVLASRAAPNGRLPLTNPSSPDISIGAFVLPNAVIPDNARLTDFAVPVDSVERAAGLMLFSPQVKASAKELCRETRCEVIVRRFDDARKQTKGKGGRS